MHSLAVLSTIAVIASAAFTPPRAEYGIRLNDRDGSTGSSSLYAKRTVIAATNDEQPVISSTRISSVQQLIYDITIQLGDINTTLLVDSGSFSLWTAQKDYNCSDGYHVFAQSRCNLNSSWSPDADKKAKRWKDVNYYESYGSGYAQGIAYNTSVTIAGMTIDEYPIGYANEVDFRGGDGIASGIIGLGLGVATGFANSTWGTLAPKGLFTLLKDKISTWQFAITLAPGISDGATLTSTHGELAFGGLTKDMSDAIDGSPFVTVKISEADTRKGYSYWGGIVDGWTYPNGSTGYAKPFSDDVLFDSGTAFVALDRGTFALYNALWNETAELRRTNETNSPYYYFLNCTASAPDLSIILDGQWRNISSQDLIYRYPNGTCMSAVALNSNSAHNILGAPFFKSNVVVFDGDEKAIHVAQKKNRIVGI